ncbi:MAG: hypothetical protein JHC33_11495 [Ignisphaera sp.]|jgi:hypothetical protein|nr:hypothetical protein [Ignisphaera sp.]
MTIKEYIENKYDATFADNGKGLFLAGMLGVIYEESPDRLEERYQNLINMADSSWKNKQVLVQMEKALLASSSGHALEHMTAQINLAKRIKRCPVSCVIERGEFAGLNYIVFNDFYFDACA